VTPLFGLVLAVAVALTACGGDDSDPAAAGADSAGGVSTGDPILDFYQCLRDNGMDVQDPPGDGRGVAIGPDSGIDPDNPDHMATVQDCAEQHDLGGPGAGGAATRGDADSLADPEALLEFVQCMRDNGIDMPDPTADGGLRPPEGFSMNSPNPEWDAAFDVCQEHLAGGGVMLRR
jgi:hypothetical protein